MRFGFRELVFMLLLLAIPAGAYALLFRPRNLQMAEARAEIERRQKTLTALDRAEGQTGTLSQEIDQLQAAIDELDASLPDRDEIDDVLQSITEIAREHDLRIASVRPDQDSNNTKWSEKPLDIEIYGDFDHFYSFLVQLEQMPRLTKVSNIKLTRVPNDEENPVRVEMTLIIFFRG